MKKILDNNGFTLLSGAIAAVILGLGIQFALSTYFIDNKSGEESTAGIAGFEVIDAIKFKVLHKMGEYYNLVETSTPVCRSYAGASPILGFRHFWQGTTLRGGVQLSIMDPDTSHPLYNAAFDPAKLPDFSTNPTGSLLEAAKKRCISSQTLVRAPAATIDFSSEKGIYFCLAITSVPGITRDPKDLLNMQPLFGEFYYSPWDAATERHLACSESGLPWRVPNGSSLDYTIYWTDNTNEKPKYKSLNGTYHLTGR